MLNKLILRQTEADLRLFLPERVVGFLFSVRGGLYHQRFFAQARTAPTMCREHHRIEKRKQIGNKSGCDISDTTQQITNTQFKTNALQEEKKANVNEMPGGQSGIHPRGCRRYHLVLLPQATNGKKQKKRGGFTDGTNESAPGMLFGRPN